MAHQNQFNWFGGFQFGFLTKSKLDHIKFETLSKEELQRVPLSYLTLKKLKQICKAKGLVQHGNFELVKKRVRHYSLSLDLPVEDEETRADRRAKDQKYWNDHRDAINAKRRQRDADNRDKVEERNRKRRLQYRLDQMASIEWLERVEREEAINGE